jgi:hypothetical protein
MLDRSLAARSRSERAASCEDSSKLRVKYRAGEARLALCFFSPIAFTNALNFSRFLCLTVRLRCDLRDVAGLPRVRNSPLSYGSGIRVTSERGRAGSRSVSLSAVAALLKRPPRKGESPLRVRQTPSAFHPHAQRNAFPLSRCASAIQIVRPLESTTLNRATDKPYSQVADASPTATVTDWKSSRSYRRSWSD